MSTRTSHILAISILFVAPLAAFGPVLGNGFVSWGDQVDIVNNPNFRGLAPANLVWMFTTIQMGHYQPLAWISLAIDYTIWQDDARGYHLTSLLLHAGCAIAVYFLIIRLVEIAKAPLGAAARRWLPWAALIAALLFAVHPLRVETVAWATERRGSLFALFLLVSVNLYLKHVQNNPTITGRWDLFLDGSRSAFRWSVIFYLLSLLTKEFGITLPAVLLVLDAYPLRRIRSWRDWSTFRALVVEKTPYIILATAGTAIALASSVQSGVAKSVTDYTVFQRLAQSFYGLAFYLWKMLVPKDLSPLYAIPLKFDPWSNAYLFSAAVVVTLTLALFAVRHRWPALLAAWVCCAIVLSPVLGIVQTGRQMAADRYTYLPAVAVSALIAAFVLQLLVRGGLGWRLVTLAFAAGISISLAAGSWRYALTWRDSLSLWSQAVKVEPWNQHARNNLGVAYLEVNRTTEAVAEFEAALAIDDQMTDARNNLGAALASQGRLEEAIEHWKRVLESAPGDSDAAANIELARELLRNK